MQLQIYFCMFNIFKKLFYRQEKNSADCLLHTIMYEEENLGEECIPTLLLCMSSHAFSCQIINLQNRAKTFCKREMYKQNNVCLLKLISQFTLSDFVNGLDIRSILQRKSEHIIITKLIALIPTTYILSNSITYTYKS